MSDCCETDSILKQALLEDIGEGDITTCTVVPDGHRSQAVILAKEKFILAGMPFAEKIFKLVNPKQKFSARKREGERVGKGTILAKISGETRGLLMAERTALNFLQRLSGIATLTNRFINCVKGLPVKIVDTRKTTPGFRFFEKYAVRIGGGFNHRSGLYDGVLIKDNHINAAGSVEKAIKIAKKNVQHMLKIEVEVKNRKQLRSALSAGADIIMLDNMSLKSLREAVNIIRKTRQKVIIEASGEITINNVKEVAKTGVDLISIGALTHSAPVVDLSMDIMPRR
jgi:nicotinate-nucleotide pyrophosphorylase (carboxylating)